MLVSVIYSTNKSNYIFFGVDCFYLTPTLGCFNPITTKPTWNQQNKQRLFENVGVSDDYDSLNLQNIVTNGYESLQLNNKD